jgi:hypothetical protein
MSFKRRFTKRVSRKSKFFQGELMECSNCGRLEKSDPNVQSNWTVIEIPETPIVKYFCPDCFGNAHRK